MQVGLGPRLHDVELAALNVDLKVVYLQSRVATEQEQHELKTHRKLLVTAVSGRCL